MSATAAVETAPEASGSDGTEKKRSNVDEEALDRRIKEIQEKNRLIEERQKVKQEEARENGVPKAISQPIANGEDGRLVKVNDEELKSRKSMTFNEDSIQQQKRNGNNNNRHRSARGQASSTMAKSYEKAPKWSREWDAGKLSADQRKMNVPKLDDALPSGARPSRANNRRAVSRKPTAENYRPAQRNVKPASGSDAARQPRTPRNPGFFHDDRFAPAANSVVAASEGNVTVGPPTRRRKPVITGLLSRAAQTNEKEDLITGRNSRGSHVNKTSRDVKITGERKSSGPTYERPSSNHDGRGRYGGGARRTSANDESDKTENAAIIKRRRLNNRDEVRRVVRSIVNRVCVELGESVGAPTNERRGRRNAAERTENSKENREKSDADVKDCSVKDGSVMAGLTTEAASIDPSETIPSRNETNKQK